MTVTSAPAATSCPTSCDSLSVIAACLQVILVQLLPDTAGQEVRPAREVFVRLVGLQEAVEQLGNILVTFSFLVSLHPTWILIQMACVACKTKFNPQCSANQRLLTPTT